MTTFTGTTGNDVFDNSAVSTDDVFTTLAGDDSINAGGGNDTVDAGVGHDTANGGAGTDVLKVNWASSAWGISYQVIPAVGNAVVLTYSSSYQAIADTLALSGSAISLTTQDGVNTLSYTGMEQYQLQGSDLWGDAWYNSSLSADLLIYQGTGGSYRGGGADGYTYYGVYDTFYANWTSATTAITWVNDPSGVDQTVNGVIVSGVERLLISTGSGNDTLNNTAVNTDDVFISGAGADSISAGGGNDSVDSGDGNDSVLAGTGDDTVLGGLGDDTLDGGAGSDSINAGGGNDTLLDINPIDGGDDTVDGGIGFDTLNVDWSSSATGINYLAVAGDGSETELSYNSSYTAIRDAIAGARLELWTHDGSHALRVSNVERYNLQGSNVAEYAYSSDLLIFQGSGGSYKGGNAAEYTAGSGYDTFYADWGSTATAIQWVNYPSGVSQLVNGATITGVERLLLKTGSGADVLDNTSVSTDDVFITGAGNDSVNAGGGDDFVDGGTGNDTLNGGAGIDTLGYDGATGSVTVNLSTGVATGANGTDTLSGFENIVGSAYGDALTGDANANVLDGGAGVDTLSGGAGDDTYVVDVAGDVIVEGSDAGIDTVVSTISYVLAANLENLTLSGSGNIDGTGNNLDNLIIANAGNNGIDGSTGTDTVSYANAGSGLTLNLGLTSAQATGGSGSDTLLNIENLIGSVYDDNLTGSAGNNQLKGGDGNDTLDGAAGADTLTGGNGSDVYVVDNAADVVVETEVDSFMGGSDLVLSQLTAYTLADNVEQGTIMLTGAANLTGNDLDNLLTAAAGNNVLSGGAGNDTVSYANATSAVTVSLAVTTAQATGGSGSDTLIDIEDLIGSAYNDTLSGSGSGNTFDGGAGTDTVSYAGAGGGVSVSLAIVGAQATGSSGLDTLMGIENLSGSNWDDALTGDGNSNTLMGGAGADSLDGGAGADSLVGGDGSDTYYVDDASDVVSETNADSVSGGVDTVYSSLSAYTLGSSVENGIITSAGAANLTGNSLNNTLVSGAGNNILDGGLGVDTVSYANAALAVTVNLGVSTAQATGGSGSDTLSGIENLVGSLNNDKLTGDGKGNVLSGGMGNDTLNGGVGSDTLIGGEGSDAYYVDSAGDVVIELSNGGGADVVYSSLSAYTLGANVENGGVDTAGVASLTGNELNNLINTNSGDNVIDGLAGVDTVSYSWAWSGVTVSLGVTTAQVTGGSGADTLLNIENLTGSNYNDILSGNAGDNVLDGRSGTDTISYANATAGVAVSLSVASAQVTGGAGVDTLSNFENLTGSGYNDTLSGSGGDNVITGGAGVDTMSYVNATAAVTVSLGVATAQVTGGSGSDTLIEVENLTGSSYADSLTGNAGDNVIDGGIGADTMVGGNGSDTYYVDNAADVVIESNATQAIGGTDTVMTSLANYTLGVNVENGQINSTGAANLTGNSGNNILVAGAGDNILSGGSGIDTLSYVKAGGGVTVTLAVMTAQATGGSGIDTLSGFENLEGSVYNDNLGGDAGNNVINGGAGNDTANYSSATSAVSLDLNQSGAQATGGAGSDTLIDIESLTGSNYNDSLTGNNGNNTLDGGAGADTLVGGDGSDTYYVDDAADIVTESNATPATGGLDTVITSLSSYTLGANVENGQLTNTGAANLTGNSLDNILGSGAGDNILSAGAGIDTVSYAGAGGGVSVSLAIVGAQATGSSGLDTLMGIENLSGSNWDDALTGDGNSNTLMGGAGADSLDGGAGADSLVGGDGSDTYYVDDASDVVSETNADSVSGGVDTVYSSLSAYTLGSSVENGIITSAGAANLTGNSLNNTLVSGAGNNILDGGLGVDTVSYANAALAVTVNLGVSTAQATGGSGSDTLSGIENLVGSLNNDKLTGDGKGNVLSGGMGNDTLNGGVGSDTLIGGEGSDAYYVDSAGDVVIELSNGGGADVVYSSLSAYTLGANVENGGVDTAGVASLTGNELNNLINTNSGDNVIDGLAGVDTVSYSWAWSGVTVSLGVTTAQVTGGSGADTLLNIENLTGSNYNDILSGNAGDNVLDGRSGTDTISYANATAGVAVSLSVASAQVTGGAGVDTLSNFENLTGSGYNDTLSGSGGDNVITGGAGVDTMSYVNATAAVTVSLGVATAQVTGGSGSDTLIEVENLTGSSYADSLTGNAGDNVIDGGIGADTMVGGNGSDTYYVDNAADVVIESNATQAIGGTDTVMTSLANYTLGVNVENGQINSTGAANLTGNSGNNILVAGAGDNILSGGSGIDTVSYNYASSGVVVNLALTTLQMTGGSGNDVLLDFENIVGSAYSDNMIGTSFNNSMAGGGGDDTLNGGFGADTMIGGDGSDTYYVDDAFDVVQEVQWSNLIGGFDTVYSTLINYTLGNNIENGVIFSAGVANMIGNGLDNILVAGNGSNILSGGSGRDTVSYVMATSGVFVNIGFVGVQLTGGSGNDTLDGIENLIGGAYADKLYGSVDNNVIDGGAGDDVLVGGDGDDVLTGGLGVDTASYESAALAVTVNLGVSTAQATGGSGSDTLSGIENLVGSLNNDKLTGDGKGNVLSGGMGNDTLNGGVGSDTLIGGEGSDAYYVDSAGDVVIELSNGGGADVVYSSLSAYTLGANVENGGVDTAGVASLTGNELNNLINTNSGDNVIDGLAGVDTVSYSWAWSGVTVSLGVTTAQVTGGSGADTLLNIENLTGSNYNDILSGNAGDNVLDGRSGTDTISYANATAGVAVSLSVASAQVTGGAGVDTLSNFENLTGSGYNDTLSGSGGDNVITGGAGVDTMSYVNATAAVTVSLGVATAQVTGGSGSDTLIEVENLTGSSYADSLTGNAGDNVIDGGIGADTMVGGNGSDTYYVDNAADVVIESNATQAIGGTDTVMTSLANYTLGVNVENGQINSTGAANLTGNSGNNILVAGAGDNILSGGSGIDTLSYVKAGGGVTVTLAVMTAQATGGSGIDTLSGFENLEGSVYNDNLGGDAGNNVINGGAGNDTANYSSATSAVSLDLNQSGAQATGGAGSDTLIDIESLTGSNYNDSLTGNNGNNTLDGGAGADTLVGGDGSDTYYVDDAADIVTESNATPATGGLDTVITSLSSYTLGANVENGQLTNTGAANLTGNSLDNILGSGAGDNILSAGAGIDTVSYAGAGGGVSVSLAIVGAQATGSSGLDTLMGIENLSGSNWDDALTGDGNSNTLMGGAGADSLDGGAGADSLVGGDGSDTYYVDDASDVVSETNADSVSGGVDTVYSSLSAYTLGSSVENGIITSAGAANLTGNSLNNTLVSGAGNNILDGGLGVDTVSYANAALAVTVNLGVSTAQATGGSGSDTLSGIENLVGSLNNDKLTGDGKGNVLSGGMGNDTLNGGVGSDTLIGGEGSDAYYVDSAGDVVIELSNGGGADVVYSSLSAYTLGANVENGGVDTAGVASLTGNELNNLINTNSGDNVIDGLAGVDTVSYSWAWSGVTVSLGVTTAQVTGGSGADTLLNIENLTGSNYNDILSGNAGDNVISGGAGNDTLTGNAGRDTLAGGAGNDVFDFNALADLGLGSTARDIITDFTAGQDLIDLSGIDADALLAGDQAFTLVTSFTTAGGEISYSNGILYFNTDNDTAAEYEIQLTGTIPASLTAANFIL